jgi:SAM-dependent methyltransferase
LAEHSLDLVVMHSVAQYLMAAGAGAPFALFHRLLKPGGVLVVSDVMSPEVMAATDAWALLRFGQANGFFLAALWGLLRALLSDYWRLRSRLGLTRYAEAAMIEKLGATGFAADEPRLTSATTRRAKPTMRGRNDDEPTCPQHRPGGCQPHRSARGGHRAPQSDLVRAQYRESNAEILYLLGNTLPLNSRGTSSWP